MELVLYHHLTSSVHHLHLQDSEALSEGKKKILDVLCGLWSKCDIKMFQPTTKGQQHRVAI